MWTSACRRKEGETAQPSLSQVKVPRPFGDYSIAASTSARESLAKVVA
jgi:hypothetical protein